MGRNLEIVRGLNEKFSETDFDALREALTQRESQIPPAAEELWEFARRHVDPNISLENGASSFSLPDIPRGTTLHGWAGWFRFWRSWFEPWARFETRFDDLVEVGDEVVLDLKVTASGRGSGLGMRVANSQVWTVRRGKIARIRLFDTREQALAAARSDE